jgi:hypothetical protein
VLSESPKWRSAIRAQVQKQRWQREQQDQARRQAQEQEAQRQAMAALAVRQQWEREQQQRARELHAEQQRLLEAERERRRQHYMQAQGALETQAQEAQQRIAGQRPMQNLLERKRGVRKTMEQLGAHTKRARTSGQPEPQVLPAREPEPEWSAEELRLLDQLAASATSRDWSAIAARLPGRKAERCCERWAASFVPVLKVVAAGADLRPEAVGAAASSAIAADDEAAVAECQSIIEDLAPRWRDAISFMAAPDAREVRRSWQVYHTAEPQAPKETEEEEDEEDEDEDEESEEPSAPTSPPRAIAEADEAAEAASLMIVSAGSASARTDHSSAKVAPGDSTADPEASSAGELPTDEDGSATAVKPESDGGEHTGATAGKAENLDPEAPPTESEENLPAQGASASRA